MVATDAETSDDEYLTITTPEGEAICKMTRGHIKWMIDQEFLVCDDGFALTDAGREYLIEERKKSIQ
jgi:hypothetical protein